MEMLDNGVGCRFCQQNVVAGTLTIKLCQYTLLITIYSMASFNVNFLMAFMLLFQPSELQQGQQMRRIQPISISSYQNEGWTMRMAWLLLNRWKMFNAKSDGSLQFGFEMKQYNFGDELAEFGEAHIHHIFPYSSLILYTNSDITRFPPGILFPISFNKLIFPKLVFLRIWHLR